MPTYRIRAQWFGPDGRQCGVADDTVRAEDACEVAQLHVCPNPYTVGEFTSATIKIEKLSDSDPVETNDRGPALMSKAIYLTSDAANLLIRIAHETTHLPAGKPVKIVDGVTAIHALELELSGMIRFEDGDDGVGSVVTDRGLAFVRDAVRHLRKSAHN